MKRVFAAVQDSKALQDRLNKTTGLCKKIKTFLKTNWIPNFIITAGFMVVPRMNV